MTQYIIHDHNHDGIDRRGFLKCMAWAGTGAFCVIKGGVLKSYSLSQMAHHDAASLEGEPLLPSTGLAFSREKEIHHENVLQK